MTFSVQKFYYNWVLMLWSIFYFTCVHSRNRFFGFRVYSENHQRPIPIQPHGWRRIRRCRRRNVETLKFGEKRGRRRRRSATFVFGRHDDVEIVFKVFQGMFLTLYFYSFLAKLKKTKKNRLIFQSCVSLCPNLTFNFAVTIFCQN